MLKWILIIGIILAVAIPKAENTKSYTVPNHQKTQSNVKTSQKKLTPEEKLAQVKKENRQTLEKIIKTLKELDRFRDYKKITLTQLHSKVKTMRSSGRLLNLQENSYKKTNPKLYKQALALQLKVQKKHYPKMRDALGPLLREKMWEYDVTVKTIGKGYTRMVLTGAFFAANRNIKKIKDSISVMLSDYRFQRVDFKWMKRAREWTYFNLSNKRDSKL